MKIQKIKGKWYLAGMAVCVLLFGVSLFQVILGAQKRMNKQGQMVVRHVNETIMEVFEVTGFVDILTIEA